MNKPTFTLSVSASVLAVLAGAATAQPRDDAGNTGIPVATDAIEVSFTGTYVQGTGDFGSAMSNINRHLGPGFGGEITLGARVTPNLALAAYGVFSGFSDGAADNHVAIGAAGLKLDWHFQPHASADPWISVGAGVKELWVGNRNYFESELVGLELVKLQAGIDYRVSSSVSFGPVIGVSAAMFTHQKTRIGGDYSALDDRNVSYLVTAGLVGRFNLGIAR
jgi:hypothetical protein